MTVEQQLRQSVAPVIEVLFNYLERGATAQQVAVLLINGGVEIMRAQLGDEAAAEWMEAAFDEVAETIFLSDDQMARRRRLDFDVIQGGRDDRPD